MKKNAAMSDAPKYAIAISSVSHPVNGWLRKSMIATSGSIANAAISTAAFAAKAQQDRDNDAFKRLEQSLALARDKASLSESNYARQLMELDARLIALETQVKRLKLEFESNGKRPSDSTGP